MFSNTHTHTAPEVTRLPGNVPSPFAPLRRSGVGGRRRLAFVAAPQRHADAPGACTGAMAPPVATRRNGADGEGQIAATRSQRGASSHREAAGRGIVCGRFSVQRPARHASVCVHACMHACVARHNQSFIGVSCSSMISVLSGHLRSWASPCAWFWSCIWFRFDGTGFGVDSCWLLHRHGHRGDCFLAWPWFVRGAGPF